MRKKIVAEKISADHKQHLLAAGDALYILSAKWKLMIIGHLASGSLRYTELQRAIEGIGPKMLSRELQDLEQNELISRHTLPTKPVTVEYELTAYGYTLKPIIDEMAMWANRHKERMDKK